ncbi:MAG: hypothetical protein HRT68_16860, partial [Flavobacteriaceae bacterium]|nr:hypothetical protein [Flavobacteriaceae bacterium]
MDAKKINSKLAFFDVLDRRFFLVQAIYSDARSNYSGPKKAKQEFETMKNAMAQLEKNCPDFADKIDLSQNNQ